MSSLFGRLQKIIPVKESEVRSVFYSFAYFFFLLSGYYVLRPIRDEMGIRGGVENLQWLFSGTFLAILAAVPVYAGVVSKYPRRKFLPWVYRFFMINIFIFWVLFHLEKQTHWTARAFFVWISVFNLFVVSVFWSFMADLFDRDQAKRLFGFIAAGGTVGALTGPAITGLLARPLGTVNLLLISLVLLEGAVQCINRLTRTSEETAFKKENPADESPGKSRARKETVIGGTPFSGIRLVFQSWYLAGVCLFIFLYTAGSTFLYFAQAQIIEASLPSSAARTSVFALMDFLTNALTLFLQTFVAGKLLKRLGMPLSLLLLPALTVCGFLLLGTLPALGTVIVFQVLRRSLNYSITRPAREGLFTILGREIKYKSKNFIDTVVYRGGDAVTAWAFAGLKAAGFSLPVLMFMAVPLSLIWAATGFFLGKKYES